MHLKFLQRREQTKAKLNRGKKNIVKIKGIETKRPYKVSIKQRVASLEMLTRLTIFWLN